MSQKTDTLNHDELLKLSLIFKMLNHPSRLKILHTLAQGPMPVDALTKVLGMTQSAVSHQLKALRDAELVAFEKRGKFSYYALADQHVYEIYKQALEHVREDCETKR